MPLIPELLLDDLKGVTLRTGKASQVTYSHPYPANIGKQHIICRRTVRVLTIQWYRQFKKNSIKVQHHFAGTVYGSAFVVTDFGEGACEVFSRAVTCESKLVR